MLRKNNELERTDLTIADEIICENHVLNVYFETWFDVESKFGITIPDDDAWLNMYVDFNVKTEEITVNCQIDRRNGSKWFVYQPSLNEEALLKDMIRETLYQRYGVSPLEFCQN